MKRRENSTMKLDFWREWRNSKVHMNISEIYIQKLQNKTLSTMKRSIDVVKRKKQT